jgi:hypothetical protein
MNTVELLSVALRTGQHAVVYVALRDTILNDNPSCTVCLSWGALPGKVCQACYSFRKTDVAGECAACRRVVPIKNGGEPNMAESGNGPSAGGISDPGCFSRLKVTGSWGGPRISEAAALDVSDVSLSAPQGPCRFPLRQG